MKIQKLMQVAMLMGAAFTATAQAQQQPYYRDNPGYGYRDQDRDYRRDLHRREALERRVEADRRAVDRERRELRHSNFFERGHERRELTNAERRLDRDLAELRALDARLNRGHGYR